jgi:hypothetical protein
MTDFVEALMDRLSLSSVQRRSNMESEEEPVMRRLIKAWPDSRPEYSARPTRVSSQMYDEQ